MTQLLPKKNPKKLIFESSLFNYSEKWLQITWKCENWKWPLVSLTSIFTASTWSIIKSRDSFEILRTCRFKNWPYFLNLVKIWGSYCQETKKRKSEKHPLYTIKCFDFQVLETTVTCLMLTWYCPMWTMLSTLSVLMETRPRSPAVVKQCPI